MTIAVKTEKNITGNGKFRVQNVRGEPSFDDGDNVGGVCEAEEFEFINSGEEAAGIEIEGL